VQADLHEAASTNNPDICLVVALTLRDVRFAQADLARARSACEAAAEETSVLRVEADSLRKAMRAMEGRLAEYQAKDTEVCANRGVV
jgi:hypothetical protein